ncbi:DUF2817 domain-containing protein [Winogradskyella sp. DF17]|uniref:DUF2817 domain-containing protein n=1 Tax=Winogradskyella pelagia TaxID=2819984 RepID=A0ABS3T2B6_9FLAO|nr:DUF2817 domain-containing protein [Winogradskyella sp. DF17]MBO3116886.1 DUF2817 domain-containing protein [Winogradskyella sp. DF17]
MTINNLKSLYDSIKASQLFGRYITNTDIEKCLSHLPEKTYSIVGHSVEKRPIYSVKFGEGPNRILMWSQMHGNESTTTKALFDCFNLFLLDHPVAKLILEQCTLLVIPILNPDGAQYYMRTNANNVDLNRDAQQRSQPESILLRDIYEDFKPDFCFNLHGQRTIFGAGTNGKAATLSFLSPSQDNSRTVTQNRKIAMALIAAIAGDLIDAIPEGIGRYDDGFNLNCVGDTFQSLGTPTILYEAGHYPEDYNREDVRYFVFLALIKGLSIISKGITAKGFESYFRIPENTKNYRDILIQNAVLSKNDQELANIVIQLKEELQQNGIYFLPIVESISETTNLKFHRVIDAKGALVQTMDRKEIYVGYENDFVLINNKKYAVKQ